MKLHLPVRLFRAVLATFAIVAAAGSISDVRADLGEDDGYYEVEDVLYENYPINKTSLGKDDFNYYGGGAILSTNADISWSSVGDVRIVDNSKVITYNVRSASLHCNGGLFKTTGKFSIDDAADVTITGNVLDISGSYDLYFRCSLEAMGGVVYAGGEFSVTDSGNVNISSNGIDAGAASVFSSDDALVYGGAVCSNGVTISGNKNVTVSNNFTDAYIGWKSHGGAFYSKGDVTFNDNTGNIDISGNKAQGEGGAIWGYKVSFLNNGGNVTISGNSAEGVGAIYCNTLLLEGNGNIEFSSNTRTGFASAECVEVTYTDMSLIRNGDITISHNGNESDAETDLSQTMFRISRGGLFIQDNGDMTISGNEGHVFDVAEGAEVSGNGDIVIEQNKGYVFESQVITLSNNGDVEIENNRSCVFHGQSACSIEENGEVILSGNARNFYVSGPLTIKKNGNISVTGNGSSGISADSDIELAGNGNISIQNNSSHGIAGADVRIYGNGDVTIRGNGENGELRGIRMSGSTLQLSASAGNTISLYDASSTASKAQILLNSDYVDDSGNIQRATGDIVFSGEYAADDLQRILGSTPTDEQLAAGRLYDMNGSITLASGALVLKSGATLKTEQIALTDGRAAALQLSDVAVNVGTGGVYIGHGHTWKISGLNSVTAGNVLLSRGCILDIHLADEHKETAALEMGGLLVTGGFTIQLNADNTLTPGSYKLLTLGEEGMWGTANTWTKNFVSVSGLGADFADLVWKEGTLYLNYNSSTPVVGDWVGSAMEWSPSYQLPASGYRQASISQIADLNSVKDEMSALALTVSGHLGVNVSDCAWWTAETPLLASSNLIFSGRAAGADSLSFTRASALVSATGSSVTVSNFGELIMGQNDAAILGGDVELAHNGVVLVNGNPVTLAQAGATVLRSNGLIVISDNDAPVFDSDELTVSDNDTVTLLNNGASALSSRGGATFTGNREISIMGNYKGVSTTGDIELSGNASIYVSENTFRAVVAGGSISITGNTEEILVYQNSGKVVYASDSVSLSNNTSSVEFCSNLGVSIDAGKEVSISKNAAVLAFLQNEDTVINAGQTVDILDNKASLVFSGNKGVVINAKNINIRNNEADISFSSQGTALQATNVLISGHADASLSFSDFTGDGIKGTTVTVQKNAYLDFANSEEILKSGSAIDASTLAIQSNELLAFSNIHCTESSGAAIYVSRLEWNNNENALFQGNSSATSGGAIWASSLTMENNQKGSLVFNMNKANNGGAILSSAAKISGFENIAFNDNVAYATGGAFSASSALDMNDIRNVSFKGNSASSSSVAVYGGAMHLKCSNRSTLSQIGTLSFIDNKAESESHFCSGGAIYVSSNVLDITNIQSLYFTDNEVRSDSANTRGGAVSVSNLGSIYVQRSGAVEVSGNSAVSDIKEAQGGAIGSVTGVVLLADNESLVVKGNHASSINAKGGAIYCSDSLFEMYGNSYAEFRGNYEEDGSDYRLRSLYYTEGYKTKDSLFRVVLSSADKGTLFFYDSIYLDATNNSLCALNFNPDANKGINGDIIFSGATTEEDLLKLKGENPTTEEINLSRTSEIIGTALICGGRVIVQDQAVLKATELIVYNVNQSAELYLNNGVLDMRRSGVYNDLGVVEGSVLRAAGNSEVYAGRVEMAEGSTLGFNISAQNLAAPALTLTGSLLQSGTLTLDISVADGATLAAGEYKLLTLAGIGASADMDFSKLVCSGILADTESLYWQNNTLYMSYELRNLTWNGSDGEVWSTSGGSVWDHEGSVTVFRNGNGAVFNKGGSVSIQGEVAPVSLLVENATELAFTGKGAITGATSLVKNGSGELVLNASNSYTGGTDIAAGRVKATGSHSFGSGEIRLTGGTLDLNEQAVANNITVTGDSSISGASAASGLLILKSGILSSSTVTKGNVRLLGGIYMNTAAAPHYISKATSSFEGASLKGDFSISDSAAWDVRKDTAIEGCLTLAGGSLALHHTLLSVSGTLTLGNTTLTLDGEYADGNSYTLITANNITGNVDALAIAGSPESYNLGISGNELKLYVGVLPDTPVVPDEPVIPDEPVVPDEPVIPDEPVVPDEPVIPDEPVVPDEPVIPDEPVVPDEPVIPDEPVVPDEPVIPDEPVVPDEPVIPDEPAVPDEPGNLESFNVYGKVLAGYEVDADTELVFGYSSPGSVTLQGKVAPGSIYVNTNKKLTLKSNKKNPGYLAGDGDLLKFGSGTLTLNDGNGSWKGDIHLYDGGITVKGSSSLGRGTVYVNGGALNLASKTVSNAIEQSGSATIKGGKKYAGIYTLLSGELQKGSTLNVAKTATLAGGTVNGTLSGLGTVKVTGNVKLGDKGKITSAALTLEKDSELSTSAKGLSSSKTDISMGNDSTLTLGGKLSANSLSMDGATLETTAPKAAGVSVKNGVSLKSGASLKLNGKMTTASLMMSDSSLSLDNAKPQSITVKGSASLTNSTIALDGKMTAANLTLNNSSMTLSAAKPQNLTVKQNLTLGSGSSLSLNGKLSAGNLSLKDGSSLTLTGSKPQTLKVKGSLTLNSGSSIILDYDFVQGKTYKLLTFKSYSGTSDFCSIFGVDEDDCVFENTGKAITMTLTGYWNPKAPSAVSDVAPAPVAAAVVEANPVADALVQANWGQLEASRAFVNAIANRSMAVQLGRGERAVWASAIGGSSRHSSAHGHAGADTNISGGAFGLETQVGRASLFGLALGNSWTRVSAHGFDTIKQDTTHLGIYGQTNWRKVSADWSAAYGRSESEVMGSDWNQKHLQLDGRVSYNHELSESTVLSGFGGMQYYASDSANVDGIDTGSLQNLRAEIGVGASHRVGKLSLYGEAAVHQDLVRHNPEVSMEGLRFGGMNPGRTGLNFTVGASYELSEQWSVNASYTGEVVENANAHSANIGVSYKF